jgi:hypothetical protein
LLGLATRAVVEDEELRAPRLVANPGYERVVIQDDYIRLLARPRTPIIGGTRAASPVHPT